MKLTKNEKKVARAIVFSVLIQTAIIGIISSLILWYSQKHQNDTSFRNFVIGIILSFVLENVVLFLAREPLLKFVYKIISFFSKEDTLGEWTVLITYKDKQGIEKTRQTNCTIEESFMGLKITGKAIWDQESNSEEVHAWLAEKADVYSYRNVDKQTMIALVYHYTTYDKKADKEAENPTKTGLVTATKLDGKNQFVGVFRDYEVDSDKTIREGTVILRKVD